MACASRSPSISSSLQARRADVDECVRARRVVAEPRRELECALAPGERLLRVLGEHSELRQAAVRARELGRLAERLEDVDRLPGPDPRRPPVAREPVEAGHDAGTAPDRDPVAELVVEDDRAVDRDERLVEPADDVRRRRELLEELRLRRRLEALGEVRRATVVRVRLAVRVELGGPTRGDERVVGDDVFGAGSLGVVDDVGGIGVGREQRLEDLVVQTPSLDDRQAGAHRVPCELVPEAHVRGVDVEQAPALGLDRGRCPAGLHRVEQRRAHTARHDRHELDEPPFPVGEPRDPSEHRVRDGRRQLVGTRREHLGDVERVAARRLVDLRCIGAGEGGDGGRRERAELERERVGGRNRPDGRAKLVAGRRLAVAERQHEERRQRGDAAAEDGDRVERRVVGPVNVLDHEDGRPRRQLELRQQKRLDLVRRRAPGEGLSERRRDAADEVADRPERPRDREVVARPEQGARVEPEVGHEPRDERRLADAGLARDEDDAARPARGRGAGVGERGECVVPFEELHASTIDP
jgi:hypothetical protein